MPPREERLAHRNTPCGGTSCGAALDMRFVGAAVRRTPALLTARSSTRALANGLLSRRNVHSSHTRRAYWLRSERCHSYVQNRVGDARPVGAPNCMYSLIAETIDPRFAHV